MTGIQAGANICGDLKDPASAIPKGTLLSLLISMSSYALFVFFAGGAELRDASGNISDIANHTISSCAQTDKVNVFQFQYKILLLNFFYYRVVNLVSTILIVLCN